MTTVVHSFPQDVVIGRRLADLLGATHREVSLHRFPDSETRVRLDAGGETPNAIVVCGGRDPDTVALPMHFAAQTARDLGASNVGLVTPYLAYMRQDTRFAPGEAVSAAAYARFLSAAFDWVATVDPHLHRIHSLDEVFSVPALCVTSVSAIAEWIHSNVDRPLIVGPDSESAQWVQQVARLLDAPWVVLEKSRAGDRDVTVTTPRAESIRGRNPVLVDDIASSGHTLAQAATALRNAEYSAVTCVVVHAVMSEGAEAALKAAGVMRLVSTNTIAHPTNGIDISPLLATRIREVLGSEPTRASASG